MRSDEAYALERDRLDPLREFRDRFILPKAPEGQEVLYFVGNSLGPCPKNARPYVDQEMADWEKWGADGRFRKTLPWIPYHENVTGPLTRILGAQANELVVMNSLTANLHLMMVSFYRPAGKRFKILMEKGAFPSDQYAVSSQVRSWGYRPEDAVIEVGPRPGEFLIREEDFLSRIEEQGHEIALVLLEHPNYVTGQAFDVEAITRAAHRNGCRMGVDLAHGAGNLPLKLHEWGPDFAVWCSYKYLNSGPGALGGCFVHERHARDESLPRFAGWWGHNKETRLQMSPHFDPIPGAEGWQLGNPPILELASMRASLEIFEQAGMERIVEKSRELTRYFEFLAREKGLGELFEVITPSDPKRRGAQLSLRFYQDAEAVLKHLNEAGVFCDLRRPDMIRLAFSPLYIGFLDVYRLIGILETRTPGARG